MICTGYSVHASAFSFPLAESGLRKEFVYEIEPKGNFYGVTSKEIQASNGGEASITSQITGGSILTKPEQGTENYGSIKKEVPDKIMCGGTDMLIIEYLNNSYATYPFNYYKEVILSTEEQKEILSIWEEMLHKVKMAVLAFQRRIAILHKRKKIIQSIL